MFLFQCFVTFLDVLMMLCIFMVSRTSNKVALKGYAAMIISYIGSIFLIWN